MMRYLINILQIRKTEMQGIVIVIRSVFNDNNKYYLNVYLHECLYKITE